MQLVMLLEINKAQSPLSSSGGKVCKEWLQKVLTLKTLNINDTFFFAK